MSIVTTPAAPAATSYTTDSYLNVTQVANRYGVSTDTIWRWTRDGEMPKAVKIGRNCTRWRMSDLTDHEARFSVGLIVTVPFGTCFAAE